MTGVLLTTLGLAQPSRHMFGPQGGSFGRSRKCDWVLADPDCILSSLHGRVTLAGGTFLLLDESTNGIFVENSREPLGRGQSVIIHDGLRFRAGAYQIEARLVAARAEQAAAVADPFLAVSSVSGHLLPHEQQAHAALRQRTEYGDLWNQHSQDPLAYLDSPSAALLQAPSQRPVPPPVAPPPVIPLSPLPPPPARAHGYGLDDATFYPQAAPLGPVGVPRGEIPSVWPDVPPHPPGGGAMPQPMPLPPVATPFPAAPPVQPAGSSPHPAAAPASAKLIPDDFDPFRSLGVPAPRVPAHPAPVAPAPYPPAEARTPVSSPAPRPSFDQLGPDLLADVVHIEPRGPAPERSLAAEKPFDPLEALKSRREERMASLQRRAENLPRTVSAPQEPVGTDSYPLSAAAARPAATPDDAVLRALLRGMGIDAPKAAAIDGERLAEEVGSMVKVVTEGLVQLLSARQMLKSEFRMDETQIRPEENNPFKHFKLAELVLDELFVTKSGGFQSAPQAAGAAMADLQQHMLLMTSAMQRGMALMFQRLGPDAVSRAPGGDGGMRIRGLAGAVKGKWETYVETYTRMSSQIDSIAKQTVSEALAQVVEEQARKTSNEYWEKKS
jgi:predicted component of type VI protein secretion system